MRHRTLPLLLSVQLAPPVPSTNSKTYRLWPEKRTKPNNDAGDDSDDCEGGDNGNSTTDYHYDDKAKRQKRLRNGPTVPK